MNQAIRASEVRLISADGDQLGITPTRDALNQAMDQDMDLVLISAQATPPVAKIMDFTKFKFEQKKKLKEQKKNQAVVTVKEVRLSPVIELLVFCRHAFANVLDGALGCFTVVKNGTECFSHMMMTSAPRT